MTEGDIRAVMGRVPLLCYWGIGVACYDPDLPRKERKERFRKDRERLLRCGETARLVCLWLEGVPKRKTVNPCAGSYHLKHLAERAIGGYVANGEFILAAVHAGYPFRLTQGPNALFGISSKAL